MEHLTDFAQALGDFLINTKENPAAAIFAVAILVSILGYRLFGKDKPLYRAMVFVVVVLMSVFIMFVNYDVRERSASPAVPPSITRSSVGQTNASEQSKPVSADPTALTPTTSTQDSATATSNQQVDPATSLNAANARMNSPGVNPQGAVSEDHASLMLPRYYKVDAWLGMAVSEFRQKTKDLKRYRKQITFETIGPFDVNKTLSVTGVSERELEGSIIQEWEYAFYNDRLLLVRTKYQCKSFDCLSHCSGLSDSQEKAFSLDGALPAWSDLEIRYFVDEGSSLQFKFNEASQIEKEYSSYSEKRELYIDDPMMMEYNYTGVVCLGRTTIIHHDLIARD